MSGGKVSLKNLLLLMYVLSFWCILLLVLDRYGVSVSTHSLPYSIGEYNILVCVGVCAS